MFFIAFLILAWLLYLLTSIGTNPLPKVNNEGAAITDSEKETIEAALSIVTPKVRRKKIFNGKVLKIFVKHRGKPIAGADIGMITERYGKNPKCEIIGKTDASGMFDYKHEISSVSLAIAAKGYTPWYLKDANFKLGESHFIELEKEAKQIFRFEYVDGSPAKNVIVLLSKDRKLVADAVGKGEYSHLWDYAYREYRGRSDYKGEVKISGLQPTMYFLDVHLKYFAPQPSRFSAGVYKEVMMVKVPSPCIIIKMIPIFIGGFKCNPGKIINVSVFSRNSSTLITNPFALRSCYRTKRIFARTKTKGNEYIFLHAVCPLLNENEFEFLVPEATVQLFHSDYGKISFKLDLFRVENLKNYHVPLTPIPVKKKYNVSTSRLAIRLTDSLGASHKGVKFFIRHSKGRGSVSRTMYSGGEITVPPALAIVKCGSIFLRKLIKSKSFDVKPNSRIIANILYGEQLTPVKVKGFRINGDYIFGEVSVSRNNRVIDKFNFDKPFARLWLPPGDYSLRLKNGNRLFLSEFSVEQRNVKTPVEKIVEFNVSH